MFRFWLRKVPLFQVFFFYRRNGFYWNKLVAFIEAEIPDAIIIRLDSNFLQLKRLRERFPALIIGTEINASPFDETFKNIAFRPFFRRMERRSLEGTSCNFFVSSTLRNKIMGDAAHAGRDFVVHNGVDVDVFSEFPEKEKTRFSYGFKAHELVIGYTGTLDHHKKIDILLRAFERVVKHFPNARLLIVGDGVERRGLQDLAIELNIQKEVRFAGWCPHEDVPYYLNCFDLAIHHHAEDYMSPIKLFEYMACGLPVIGPRTSAVREIFEDGVHLTITDGTVLNLADKITDLLRRPDKMKALALAGKRLVDEHYTWRKNADFIIAHMERHKRGTT